jgi:thioesterase domain-containing protein
LHARHKRLLTHLRSFSHSVPKFLVSQLAKIKRRLSPGDQFNSHLAQPNHQTKREKRLKNVDQTYFKARKNYVPQTYSGNLAIFKSMQINSRKSAFGDLDSKLGWSDLATGEFDLINIPGDHLGILKEPNVAILAEELKRRLGLAIG